jgi:methylated-DNA-protein-cysteine methyltransferase-like protein
MQASSGQVLLSCAVAVFLFSLAADDYPYRHPAMEFSMDNHDSFPQRVYQIIAAIPEGHVTTYGDVARLAGSPRAARQVGGVLKRLPEGSKLPWHRVVNRQGQISLTGPDLQRQRQALLSEGIMVSGDGKIEIERYRWND